MKTSIRIYNRFLDLKGELDSFQSLQFGRNFHGIATFEIHVNRYLHEAQKLLKGDIIALDRQPNKAAIILTKEIALDENGKETENFKLSGYTLDGLMKRRITVPPSHTSHDRKSGSAEEVMKHYVGKNFVNPDDRLRNLPHLELAPNKNRGPYVSWESRFKNVAEELENISIQSGLGWGIFTDFKTKKLIFDVFEARDLTQGNPYGNNPVFFSPEFETIKSQSFVDSDTDLRNVGYVGGQGEGAERKIVTMGSDVGWERIETFIDARDVGEETEGDEENLTDAEVEELLEKRGAEKMREMETLQSLEAVILTPTNESSFQYEKDYDLGDKVDVVNKSWGIMTSAPITEFLEIYEAGGFRLEATFGRSRPTFITKMKRKFNELEGVEQQELPAQIAVETRKYTDKQLTKEEQERIEQAKANLEISKKHTEEYAEKKRIESPTEPDDKSVVWVDTSDPDNIVWKIYSEEKQEWVASARGPKGDDGVTTYMWKKYADDENGSGISDSSEGKRYLGLAHNKTTETPSNNPADYSWSSLYDNVVVGGRNHFVVKDALENTLLAWATGLPGTETGALTSGFIPVTSGDKFFISPVGTSQLFYYDSEQSHLPLGNYTGGVTITVPDNEDILYMRIVFRGNFLDGRTKEEAMVKVEKGNIATDWTPAPEDTEAEIEKAMTTADGKNTVIHLDSEPSIVGRIIGDVWFDTSDGHKMYRFNGTSWVSSQFGENAIVANSITANHIKSLAGLNVNDQFIVDENGKLTIGNDRVTIDDVGIQIKRPDGAVAISDGLTHIAYGVTGNDPNYMTAGRVIGSGVTFMAFIPAGSYVQNAAHIYGGIKGSLDGRGIDGSLAEYENVRDNLGAVAFQQYRFVHSARYLVFDFRKYGGSKFSVHVVNGASDSTDDRIFFQLLETDVAGLQKFVVDLGTPTFNARTVTFKVGWTQGWGDRMENMRFIMESVHLTDFI